MFFLLLLHFLSFFLLPIVAIQCKGKKKKNNSKSAGKPRYKQSRGFQKSGRDKKKKKRRSSASMKAALAAAKAVRRQEEALMRRKKYKIYYTDAPATATPRTIGKSGESDLSKEGEDENALLEQQAKSISDLQKAFDSRPFVPTKTYTQSELERMDVHTRQRYLDDLSAQKSQHSERFVERLSKEYGQVHSIYKEHKCPNPTKVHGQEDGCPVCSAYILWAGLHLSQGFKDDRYPTELKGGFEVDLVSYGGPLPEFLTRQPQWIEAKKAREELKLDKTQEESEKQLEKTQASEEEESSSDDSDSSESEKELEKTQASQSVKKKNS